MLPTSQTSALATALKSIGYESGIHEGEPHLQDTFLRANWIHIANARLQINIHTKLRANPLIAWTVYSLFLSANSAIRREWGDGVRDEWAIITPYQEQVKNLQHVTCQSIAQRHSGQSTSDSHHR
jgi:hypothetical protein